MGAAKYLGIDLETTGLKPHEHYICECAAVALTEDLQEVGRFVSRVSVPLFTYHSSWAVDQHLQTGLLTREGSSWVVTTKPAIELIELEIALANMIMRFPDKPILAGNSVHFDRSFLDEHMPLFAETLSHRTLDARTIEQLAPDYPWPESGTHRAEPDLDRSIAVLRIGRRLLRDGRKML